jgi:hypothetical protein
MLLSYAAITADKINQRIFMAYQIVHAGGAILYLVFFVLFFGRNLSQKLLLFWFSLVLVG